MIIDIPLLKSFVAIVDNGNFLKASEVIGRSPAAISVHINKLEQALNSQLLDRDARSTSLTFQGEKLLPHARRMLALEAGLHAEFNEDALQGTVRLGIPDDVVGRFPMQILTSFSNSYPGASLVVHIDHTPELLKAVDTGRLDLSVITYAKSIPGVLETEILMQEPRVWAMAAGGIAAEKSAIPIILWEKQQEWYQAAIDILDSCPFDYRVILDCENITARKRAIQADLGVGPLPLSEMDETLSLVPGFDELKELPQYALGLKISKTPSQVAQVVADQLRKRFS